MPSDHFIIDLRDANDLRVKRRDAERERQKWDQIVRFIDYQLRDQDSERPTPTAKATTTAAEVGSVIVAQAVEGVVNRENRPIQSLEVRDILEREGHKLSPSSVYNSLRYIALRAKRIQQLPGRGIFAPLSYEAEDQQASPNGFMDHRGEGREQSFEVGTQ